MNNLDELAAIWHAGEKAMPPIGEIKKAVDGFGAARRRKKRTTICASGALALLILAAVLLGGFERLTSFAGAGLIAGAVLFLGISNVRSLERYKGMEALSNLDFLAFMEKTKSNMLGFYKTTQPVLFAVLVIGLSLYMLEAILASPLLGLGIYLCSLAALAWCWIYLRPTYLKKNLQKLDREKAHFLILIDQFKENEI